MNKSKPGSKSEYKRYEKIKIIGFIWSQSYEIENSVIFF